MKLNHHPSMKPIVLLIVFGCFVFAAAQEPRFTDYPARVVRTRTSVRVQQNSTPDTRCFRTMLRQTAREGQRFAGHYAIDYWGCGTNCARIGIVDLANGRAYVSPFYVGIAGGGQHLSIKTKPDSKLVLVNDPEVVRKEYGDPAPEEFAPAYFLWTGKHLLPIRQGKVEQSEPRRAFDRCSKTNRR
jgi:hypothetical protein